MKISIVTTTALTLALNIITGCGIVVKTADPIDEPDLAAAVVYKLDDVACQEQSKLVNTRDYWVYESNSTGITRNLMSFNGDSRPGGLSIINSTTYGRVNHYRVKADCGALPSLWFNDFCQSGFIRQEKPKPLKICGADKQEYSEYSIERAALTTAGHLDHSASFYSTLEGRELDPVGLEVLPDIVYEADRDPTQLVAYKPLFLTDNASWSKTDTGFRFTILPDSLKKAATNNPRIWEMQWIMHHEYAHHIFYKYAADITDSQPDLTSALGRHQQIVASHDQHEFLDEDIAGRLFSSKKGLSLTGESMDQVKSTPEQYSNARMWELISLNEAFADVFAHITKGDSEGLVNFDPCFGTDRQVLGNLFASGRRKTISGAMKQKGTNGCQTDMRDPHHLGAVIAYGLYAMLAEAPALVGLEGQGKRQQEGKLLISFMEALRQPLQEQISKTHEDLGITKTAIKVAAKTFADQDQVLSTKQCQILEENFSISVAQINDSYGLKCGS